MSFDMFPDAAIDHLLNHPEGERMSENEDLNEEQEVENAENDHEVAEADKQVNDPDVDTTPAAPVEHTSNVVGRRNDGLPTEVVGTPEA